MDITRRGFTRRNPRTERDILLDRNLTGSDFTDFLQEPVKVFDSNTPSLIPPVQRVTDQVATPDLLARNVHRRQTPHSRLSRLHWMDLPPTSSVHRQPPITTQSEPSVVPSREKQLESYMRLLEAYTSRLKNHEKPSADSVRLAAMVLTVLSNPKAYENLSRFLKKRLIDLNIVFTNLLAVDVENVARNEGGDGREEPQYLELELEEIDGKDQEI